MRKFLSHIYKIQEFSKGGINKIFIEPCLKASFSECGKGVKIGRYCDVRSPENIYLGKKVQIGPYATLWTAKAKIIMGNNIIFGPHVFIITGDHRFDILGRYMVSIKNEDKLAENDQDVIIQDDVWIGANVIILKGVRVGEGSIVAAGSVVNKNVEPYSIYAGTPAKKIRNRFTQDEIKKHKFLMDNSLKAI
ncbi:acyltransferase [Clostridium lacusfryxellense]|uniref:acyltransferase n=1 Tax=Clostridium lacusfryxellense TaxID=205328 RepID=UPI001C0C4839|nr:acyltransferase [Clostridium lacusfryxellense]MBU3111053.1 acyltransferase [Clostridium lacusfryxellense]